MIDIKEIFVDENIASNVSLWLGEHNDGADLVGAAEYAAEMKVPMVSVEPNDVKTIWPWFEHLNVKIMARFTVSNLDTNGMSNLVAGINSVFKQGASGAQLVVNVTDLDKFSDSILPVREDLFFNKDLSIALDGFEIWPNDWKNVFENLRKIAASSLLLVLSRDEMEKSDFVGRIYGALDAWDADSNMNLHVMLGESHNRAEQVYRLVEKMRPELLEKLKFFVAY